MTKSPAVRTTRLLSALLLAFGLSACASMGTPGAVGNASEPAAEAPGLDDDAIPDDKLPKIPLSSELMLRFLVGDIALQRDRPQLAAQTWHDLAQRTNDPRVARRATEIAIGSGQLTIARDDAQRWIDAVPDSVAARQVMLSLLIRANRLDEAKPHIQALLAAQPEEIAPFFLQMHMLWDKNTDREAALKLTEELTTPYPKLAEARFARAVALANVGRIDDALKELDEANRLKANWEPAILYRAQLMGKSATPQARIDYLNSAERALPKSMALRSALAREYVEAGRFDAALGVYNEMLALQPNNLEALTGSGLVALQTHDLDTAEKRLTRATELAPQQTGNLRYYLGQIAEEGYRFADARDWYEAVDGEFKPSADKRLVRVLARLGDIDGAQAQVKAIPAPNDEAKIEKIQLEASIWREVKQYRKGYDLLSEGLKRYPASTDLLYDRSLFSDLMGNQAEAEAELRRYLALEPDSAIGMNALGYTLANRAAPGDKAKLVESQKLLDAALAKEPGNPTVLDSLGWLRYRQGRLNDAKTLLEKAYARMPDPEIGAHLAEVLWQLGDKAEARKIFDTAAKVDPDNEIVREAVQRLGVK
ncbi:tetratricopeptide repeat protein [Jeongeupia wiesaeckerbachi]|uniref:tetratricopeptide repeat protein n=1 Tax=Jeongeupia wiesaeckerbachi TaxID=3051218 RepID=UPI003D802158